MCLKKDQWPRSLPYSPERPRFHHPSPGQFAGKKIAVFLAALEYASKNNQGLIEATKVIEQSSELFEEPSCFSNVFNCDVISAAVYTTELAAHYDEIYKGTGD